MSQTETLLLVALGFAFALVLAMIFGFGIWSAANRWAAHKRRREVPTTILDMQAEREGLRAQNAMTARRLEFLLDDARTQAAEKTAQVTRHRNRAIVMSKDLIAKDAEIASLRALAAELTAETNKRARIIAKLTGHEAIKLRSFDLPVPEGAKPFTVPARPAKADVQAEAAPLDRIKAKIAELNALSAQIADQQTTEGRAVEEALVARETAQEPIREPVMLSALREVENELALEAAQQETSGASEPTVTAIEPEVAYVQESVPVQEAEPEKRPSLAERFRALREGA